MSLHLTASMGLGLGATTFDSHSHSRTASYICVLNSILANEEALKR